ESDRAADRLARIVDDEVEPITTAEQVAAEHLHARRVPEIDAVDREPGAPLTEIRLARIASRGVAGKPRGGDDVRAGAEEHDRGLVADLHARSGDQTDAAGEVRRLMPLRPVEVCA